MRDRKPAVIDRRYSATGGIRGIVREIAIDLAKKTTPERSLLNSVKHLTMERLLPKGAAEVATMRITVQYDNEAQIFKLIGIDLDTLVEGDALLDLDLPLLREQSEPDPVDIAVNSSFAQK